jgi:hypothetical protein
MLSDRFRKPAQMHLSWAKLIDIFSMARLFMQLPIVSVRKYH